MLPALKTLLICLLIGLGFGMYLYFTYDQRLERIVISVLSTACIGSLMMLVINYRNFFTMVTSIQSYKMIIMIILLILAALTGSEMMFFAQSLIWKNEHYQLFSGGNIYFLNILIVLVTGIPIYVSEEWKSLLNSQILSQQYRVLELEQQKTTFELELLRAKVNPHFLYNVHNTIAGLILKDPAKAEKMVLLLSKFFRFTLNKNSATFHAVSDETDIIRTYLDMQKIRFGDRLDYVIEADNTVLPLQIPSFILQPIVENALKHGIEKRKENGVVKVGIKLDGNEMLVTISDSGPEFSAMPGSGMGLQMVRTKLQLLYPGNFTLELNNEPEKHVRIIIPKRNKNVAG
ncbi:histidine kinase [Dyadobacter sp. CY356]|nr:histidine kinase [Dyadobacter sp. CY356]